MLSLLGYEFRSLSCGLAYSFVQGTSNFASNIDNDQFNTVSPQLLEPYVNAFDLKRLESYSRNLVDFHLIMDLVPSMARLYFNVLPHGAMSLSPVQAAILVGIGLQHKSIDQL
jgi:N-acetyltransferase 10